MFIDYGENYTQGDTVRGFKSHTQVSILSEPGLVDVTADIDFSQCVKAAERSFGNTTASGTDSSDKVDEQSGAERSSCAHFATQGEFLMRMGIRDRVASLIELPSTTNEEAGELVTAFKRLVGSTAQSTEYMGDKFKVLAICDPSMKCPGF
jgi:NADH dehydrogenase [ubiquinone] 1 alpha subcomplex assembly factor 7